MARDLKDVLTHSTSFFPVMKIIWISLPNFSCSKSFAASIPNLFKLWAPWLPPKKRRVSLSLSRPNFSIASSFFTFMISLRIGLPVRQVFRSSLRERYFCVSEKLRAILDAHGARSLLLRESRTFCSQIRFGMPKKKASIISGHEWKLPIPITTWGLNVRRIKKDWRKDMHKPHPKTIHLLEKYLG